MSIKRTLLGAVFVVIIGAQSALAQDAPDQDAPAQDGPLSAIDWLSDAIEAPTPAVTQHSPVSKTAVAPVVTTMALGAAQLDAVGLLPQPVSRLDASFWGNSSSADLAALIAQVRVDLPPPLAQLMRRIVLAELDAPIDANGDARLFLARLDRLLAEGALDKAKALLDRSGTDSPALFARWFDISLLTDHDDDACTAVLQDATPDPTPMARIFCQVREDDWTTAQASFDAAQSELTANEAALTDRFLHPELAEGAPFLPVPDRISPLTFRMHSAIGEPLSQVGLPNAFAFASLAPTEGWKVRLHATERLVHSGAVSASQLRGVYTERSQAASGGVWERVAAVQDLETALADDDIDQLNTLLPHATQVMAQAGLDLALGQMFGADLMAQDIDASAKKAAVRLALIGGHIDAVRKSGGVSPGLLGQLIYGSDLSQPTAGASPLETALHNGLTAPTPSVEYGDMITADRIGEAVLHALVLLENGENTDLSELEDGLAILCKTGFGNTARALAIHILARI